MEKVESGFLKQKLEECIEVELKEIKCEDVNWLNCLRIDSSDWLS
jgi:hypothetical protein